MSGVSDSPAEKSICLVSLVYLQGLCLVQWQNFIIINSVSTTTTNSNPCFKPWPCITKPAHNQLSSTEIGSRRHFLAWIKQSSCPLSTEMDLLVCLFKLWLQPCVVSKSGSPPVLNGVGPSKSRSCVVQVGAIHEEICASSSKWQPNLLYLCISQNILKVLLSRSQPAIPL